MKKKKKGTLANVLRRGRKHSLPKTGHLNIYYPDPRTAKEFQSLYANVPHFKDFLKLHQKAKFLCLEI